MAMPNTRVPLQVRSVFEITRRQEPVTASQHLKRHVDCRRRCCLCRVFCQPSAAERVYPVVSLQARSELLSGLSVAYAAQASEGACVHARLRYLVVGISVRVCAMQQAQSQPPLRNYSLLDQTYAVAAVCNTWCAHSCRRV
jgi:hypothetical protein